MLSSNSEALLRSFIGDDDMWLVLSLGEGISYQFLSSDE